MNFLKRRKEEKAAEEEKLKVKQFLDAYEELVKTYNYQLIPQLDYTQQGIMLKMGIGKKK